MKMNIVNIWSDILISSAILHYRLHLKCSSFLFYLNSSTLGRVKVLHRTVDTRHCSIESCSIVSIIYCRTFLFTQWISKETLQTAVMSRVQTTNRSQISLIDHSTGSSSQVLIQHTGMFNLPLALTCPRQGFYYLGYQMFSVQGATISILVTMNTCICKCIV